MPALSIIFFGILWYVAQMSSEYWLVMCQLNIRNIYSNGESRVVTNPEHAKYLGLQNLHSLIILIMVSLFAWPGDKNVLLLTLIVLLSLTSDLLIFFGVKPIKRDTSHLSSPIFSPQIGILNLN